MNYINYRDKVIEYTVDRGKRKHIYISIQDGKAIIKVPKRLSEKVIKEIVEKRKEWIYEKISIYMNSPQSPKKYIDGEIFKVLGEECILKIFYRDIKRCKLQRNDGNIEVFVPMDYQNIDKQIEKTEKIKKLIDKYYIEVAQEEVGIAMSKLTKIVNLRPKEYRIRNLKRAWGNCSSTKNISINKYIAKYSYKEIEYVCLHELCHLKYMNHSKDFWNMVEKYMPNYKMAEAELKKH